MESDGLDEVCLAGLANKIKRLKDRLVSYGWNKKEVYTFILFQFLKLPQVDWHKPQKTVSFYQIKQKYKVETQAAELILCIKEIVPNLQSQEVLEYLHTVFDYSAIEFGINVYDSSSDSSDNPRIVRPRPKPEKLNRKRSRSIQQSPKAIKKVHRELQQHQKRSEEEQVKIEKQKGENEREEGLRLVRKRKQQYLLDLDEYKKEIKKEDS